MTTVSGQLHGDTPVTDPDVVLAEAGELGLKVAADFFLSGAGAKGEVVLLEVEQ